jgi:hypothetical protein
MRPTTKLQSLINKVRLAERKKSIKTNAPLLKNEIGFFKETGGKIRQVKGIATPSKIKVLSIPRQKEKLSLHTHPLSNQKYLKQNQLPSLNDLAYLNHNKYLRTEIIILESLTNHKKIPGYVFVRKLTPKKEELLTLKRMTRLYLKTPSKKAWDFLLKNYPTYFNLYLRRNYKPNLKDIKKLNQEFFKIGFQIRYVPTKGHQISKNLDFNLSSK